MPSVWSGMSSPSHEQLVTGLVPCAERMVGATNTWRLRPRLPHGADWAAVSVVGSDGQPAGREVTAASCATTLPVRTIVAVAEL